MNANSKVEGGGAYGRLLSLFGRKIKPTADTNTEAEIVTPEVSPEVVPSAFGQGRRILIGDDDPIFVKTTENKLKSHGFTVLTALEGSAVLQVAREEAPDVILLDVEFPPELPTSWDGFTILEWLNQMNWLPNTPIIICTGKQDPELALRATAMRAAGLLHKPLNYSELLRLIEFKLASSQPARDGARARN